MLYQTGLNILNLYPLPTTENVPAGQSFNYTGTRPAESIYSWQPAVRLDYQAVDGAARVVQVLGVGPEGADVPRHDPRLQRHADAGRAGLEPHSVGQLPVDADDVPRGDVRPQLRISWPAARRRSRAPARSSATTPPAAQGVPVTPSASLAATGLVEPAVPVPGRDRPQARLLRDQGAQRAPAGVLGRHAAWPRSRPSQYGGRVANAPPTIGFPGWFNINTTMTSRSALTKLHGPPHVQGRLLQHPQLQGRADEQQRVRQHQLPARRSRHQSVRHVVRLRQRGDRLLPARSSRRRSTSRRHRSTTTPRATSRTTGR